MSACEKCWNEAAIRSVFNGKTTYDNYMVLLREHEALDALAASADVDAPSPTPAEGSPPAEPTR